MNKKCRICNIKLTNKNWSLSYQKYQSNICKKCDAKRGILYRKNNMDKTKIYQKNWYLNNRDKLLIEGRKRNLDFKIIVIKHYSNSTMQCNCCGEFHIEFLQIDHIDCGKLLYSKNKRPHKLYGLKLYKWLIKNNFPKGYQVLCANCNFAKGAFGKCPHKTIDGV